MSKKRKNNFPENFPPECLMIISLYMSYKGAINLFRTCKYFNEILSDGIVWSLRTKRNANFRKLCYILSEEDNIPKANILRRQTDLNISNFLKKSLFYKNLKDILYITKDKGCYGFTLSIRFERNKNIIVDNNQIITLNNVKFNDPSESPHFPPDFIGSNALIVFIDKPIFLGEERNFVYESKNINKSLNITIFVENFINECVDLGENKVCNIIKGEFVTEGYHFILYSKESYFFLFIYWGEKPKKRIYSTLPVFF